MTKKKKIKCPECGRSIDRNNDYCPHCYYDFEAEDKFNFSDDSGRSISDRLSDGFDLMHLDDED